MSLAVTKFHDERDNLASVEGDVCLFGKKVKVEVCNYNTRGQLERDAQKRMRDGWQLENQAGQFTSPWLKPWSFADKKMTVTWVKRPN